MCLYDIIFTVLAISNVLQGINFGGYLCNSIFLLCMFVRPFRLACLVPYLILYTFITTSTNDKLLHEIKGQGHSRQAIKC